MVSTHEVTGAGGGGAQGPYAHVGQVVGSNEGGAVERIDRVVADPLCGPLLYCILNLWTLFK